MTPKPLTVGLRYVEAKPDLQAFLSYRKRHNEPLLPDSSSEWIDTTYKSGRCKILIATDSRHEIVGHLIQEDLENAEGQTEWHLREIYVVSLLRRKQIGTALSTLAVLHQLVSEMTRLPIKAMNRRDNIVTQVFLMNLGIVPAYHLRSVTTADEMMQDVIEYYLDCPDAVAPKYAKFLLRHLSKTMDDIGLGEVQLVFSTYLTDHPKLLRAFAEGDLRFSDEPTPRFPASIVHL